MVTGGNFQFEHRIGSDVQTIMRPGSDCSICGFWGDGAGGAGGCGFWAAWPLDVSSCATPGGMSRGSPHDLHAISARSPSGPHICLLAPQCGSGREGRWVNTGGTGWRSCGIQVLSLARSFGSVKISRRTAAGDHLGVRAVLSQAASPPSCWSWPLESTPVYHGLVRAPPSSVDWRREMTRKTRENRQEFEQSLTSYAERTGFPVNELNRLRAERQAERRRLLTIRADTAAQVTNEDEAAFVYGVKSQRDTLGLLTTPSVITLNQPAAIGSQHHDEAKPFEFESHIEPFNSFARVLITDVHSGWDNGGVNFQFPWENASQSFAVINIGTLLRFTGLIQANSDNRFFSGEPSQCTTLCRSKRYQGGWMGSRLRRSRPWRDIGADHGKYPSTGGWVHRNRRRVV